MDKLRLINVGKSRRKFHPKISSARKVWRGSYNDGDIDFDSFYYLSQLNCEYCGDAPKQTYNLVEQGRFYHDGYFTYNGLDRVDSNRGHYKDNVVPCCITCNVAKSNISVNDFLNHIKKIYNKNFK